MSAKTERTMRESASPKAQAIRPEPEAIEPPEGWQLNSGFGFMANGTGPASRLVRLAEVLRWLGQSRGLPRKAALDALCEAMPDDVMTWLYTLRRNDYAQLVPEGYAFGFKTAAQIEAEKATHRQEVLQRGLERERDGWWGRDHLLNEAGKIRTTWPEPTEPGRPALLKLMIRTWSETKWSRTATCDVLDDRRSRLATLAIPLDKAHAVWGYGRASGSTTVASPGQLASYADLVSSRKSNPGAKWTDGMRQILADEETRRKGLPGQEGIRKALGADLDISDKRVGELIREHQESERDMARRGLRLQPGAGR